MEMPGFWDRPTESAGLMQKRRGVERKVETLKKLRADSDELGAWRELLGDDGEADPDAVAFLERLAPELAKLDLEIKLSGPDDDKNAIVAINSGAGGTESQDWAEILMRMYLRWCEEKGYNTEIVDYLPGEVAGIKSATIRVEGDYAYGYLKAEIGIHRLVRISPFDSAKRRHTSF
ncbi:MAG: PCRF domain-containing protein, partial [Acidobacteria bacterium]|nr:PCRF domain-containing protein [Acidobacteriota bacterium]